MNGAEALMQRYVEAWSDQDGDRLSDLYQPDAVRVSALGTARGREAIRAFATGLWRAAPDSRIEITLWAASDDVVFYEFVDAGTHTGPLATPAGEVMGSGRPFRIEGAGVFEIRDDRIASERVYLDPAAFLRQLGIAR